MGQARRKHEPDPRARGQIFKISSPARPAIYPSPRTSLAWPGPCLPLFIDGLHGGFRMREDEFECFGDEGMMILKNTFFAGPSRFSLAHSPRRTPKLNLACPRTKAHAQAGFRLPVHYCKLKHQKPSVLCARPSRILLARALCCTPVQLPAFPCTLLPDYLRDF